MTATETQLIAALDEARIAILILDPNSERPEAVRAVEHADEALAEARQRK